MLLGAGSRRAALVCLSICFLLFLQHLKFGPSRSSTGILCYSGNLHGETQSKSKEDIIKRRPTLSYLLCVLTHPKTFFLDFVQNFMELATELRTRQIDFGPPTSFLIQRM